MATYVGRWRTSPILASGINPTHFGTCDACLLATSYGPRHPFPWWCQRVHPSRTSICRILRRFGIDLSDRFALRPICDDCWLEEIRSFIIIKKTEKEDFLKHLRSQYRRCYCVRQDIGSYSEPRPAALHSADQPLQSQQSAETAAMAAAEAVGMMIMVVNASFPSWPKRKERGEIEPARRDGRTGWWGSVVIKNLKIGVILKLIKN